MKALGILLALLAIESSNACFFANIYPSIGRRSWTVTLRASDLRVSSLTYSLILRVMECGEKVVRVEIFGDGNRRETWSFRGEPRRYLVVNLDEAIAESNGRDLEVSIRGDVLLADEHHGLATYRPRLSAC